MQAHHFFQEATIGKTFIILNKYLLKTNERTTSCTSRPPYSIPESHQFIKGQRCLAAGCGSLPSSPPPPRRKNHLLPL